MVPSMHRKRRDAWPVTDYEDIIIQLEKCSSVIDCSEYSERGKENQNRREGTSASDQA